MQKNLLTYGIVSILIISIFGFNFLIGLLGNILILLFLTPILLIGIVFLGLNALRNSTNKCENCGAIIIGNTETCIYCGVPNINKNIKNSSIDASKEIIEIDAEEIN